MTTLDDRITALGSMTRAQLDREWRRLTRSPIPEVSRKLLALAVAYKLQERELVGLSPTLSRELSRLCDQYVRAGSLPSEPYTTLKIGSRLVRTWHGKSYHVTICEDGYLYRDQTYRSLSQIAREITGTNWSGPRFFGLNAPGKSKHG